MFDNIFQKIYNLAYISGFQQLSLYLTLCMVKMKEHTLKETFLQKVSNKLSLII